MKTYTKQDFHNPEQLTRQQVGDEYRLLLNDELPYARSYGEDIQLILEDHWVIANGDSITVSYRVPLATPLPDGAVLSSNECCFSDAPSASDDMAGLDDILGKQGYLNVNYNGITEVEQSASRIAKLLDERADCLPEVMLYRGQDGDWTVEAGNPNACVMLGEVPGIIRAEGPCLLETLSNVENALTKREEKPRKKRVYCAGSMSSHPEDYNFPAFYSAAESLEKQGYEPVNPAQLDIEAGYTLERIKELDPVEFQEFLRGAAKRDLDALQQCDAIALLPGWESSKGARAEKAVAEWLGLETIYLKGEAPTEPKQPYNSDERAEWDVSGLIPKIQSSIAPDDPKGAAGALKAPMWLLPAHSLQQTAWVHKLGSEKYGPYNWRKTSVCATTYISAIMRHLDAWRDGEDNDPESGISHIAHVAASCNILLDAQHCDRLNDDRAKLCQI